MTNFKIDFLGSENRCSGKIFRINHTRVYSKRYWGYKNIFIKWVIAFQNQVEILRISEFQKSDFLNIASQGQLGVVDLASFWAPLRPFLYRDDVMGIPVKRCKIDWEKGPNLTFPYALKFAGSWPFSRSEIIWFHFFGKGHFLNVENLTSAT